MPFQNWYYLPWFRRRIYIAVYCTVGIDTVCTCVANCFLRLKNFTVVTALPFKHCVVRKRGLAMAKISLHEIESSIQDWKCYYCIIRSRIDWEIGNERTWLVLSPKKWISEKALSRKRRQNVLSQPRGNT